MAEKESTPIANPALEGFYVAIGTILIILLVGRAIIYFDSFGNINTYLLGITGGNSGWYSQFQLFLHNFFQLYTIIAVTVSALLFLATAYANVRLRQVQAEEEEMDRAPEVGDEEPEMNAKWQKVIAHVNSDNPAEWRLAILEADVMLEEMLEKMSYQGETLGEKLKSVERSDFTTIEYAWEAHKIRNAIAHEGADFLITQREARRVIGLYEKVFKEFYYI